MTGRWLLVFALLILPARAIADEPKQDSAKPGVVPYRLTETHHTMVRVKINGKGPFNFVVDTGCPVLLIAEPVGKKIGLKVEKGWSTLDKLELEGGLSLKNVKARVETPFQIEGMNGLGLAGVELHGLMGYTVLAKFKMEFDYTKMQMIWTPLDFTPAPPKSLGGKTPTGGMDMMISLVRVLTFFAGVGPPPPPQPRGFFGFELTEKDKEVTVAKVLPKSPAAEAGLKEGDLIRASEGKEIHSVSDVLRHASQLTAGKMLNLTIERGKAKQTLKLTAGAGL